MVDLPCGWDDPVLCCDPDDFTDEVWEASVGAAAEILWKLSRRQFGVCELEFRPCRPQCLDTLGLRWWPTTSTLMAVSGSWWYPLPCGCQTNPCRCDGTIDEIVLPGPIAEITEVTIDGDVLDDSAYDVFNKRRLVRLDGESWPACQQPLAASEVGTFAVTYDRGRALTVGGRRALGKYACELAKSCTPGQHCELPGRTSQVVRQGKTLAFDIDSILDKGRTGLSTVDQWLQAVNPKAAQAPSGIWRADEVIGSRRG